MRETDRTLDPGSLSYRSGSQESPCSSHAIEAEHQIIQFSFVYVIRRACVTEIRVETQRLLRSLEENGWILVSWLNLYIEVRKGKAYCLGPAQGCFGVRTSSRILVVCGDAVSATVLYWVQLQHSSWKSVVCRASDCNRAVPEESSASKWLEGSWGAPERAGVYSKYQYRAAAYLEGLLSVLARNLLEVKIIRHRESLVESELRNIKLH